MKTYDRADIGAILRSNSYPGRGIVIGKTSDGKKAAIAYFIMGRSENSRNRIFAEEGEKVIIYPYDESKVQDPSLIIYSPIRRYQDYLIVTNGNQTDTIYTALTNHQTFEQALETRTFEPDAPNFTPRISGLLHFNLKDFSYKMSILKSADENGSACNRYTYAYSSLPGTGHFIHTYECDGNPIPTFTGEPRRIEVGSDIELFTFEIWNSLNEQNKISLYTRFIDLQTGHVENRLINKNK